jgi:predicted NAD/FAD-binding protein
MRIAIIGAGMAGNFIAHQLWHDHEITVYESASHIGGHTHTHAIEIDGEHQQIDTGFIVFNDRTYPNFMALLDKIGVQSQPSTMSFSVCKPASGLEYNGTTINTLFAQRSNFFRPSFYLFIAEILRFNREAPKLLDGGSEMALGAYLEQQAYSRAFIDDYLVPMGAAIWSTDPARMLAFPAQFFVRFFHHHGMLSVNKRPQWRVIRGGSARYVERLVAPFRDRIRLNTPVQSVVRSSDSVMIQTREAGCEYYDFVFFACHSDQALRLLGQASSLERSVLGAIAYQRNEVVLHTDTSLLPRTRRAWAAWNYHVGTESHAPVALTYNMNMLQNLQSRHTFCVTLNRGDAISPEKIIQRLSYEHPIYTPQAVMAQQRQHEINGTNRSFFCGAYWRNGFHEDAIVSAIDALKHFNETLHA